VQFGNNEQVFIKLLKMGLLVSRIYETEFSSYIATIDIDGNSSAWQGYQHAHRVRREILTGDATAYPR